MKKIIKTLFYLFCISTLSFAEEDIENTRDRGIDKMNFYIPVSKQNKYSNFTELDLRKDKNIYKWTMADGYQTLGNNWDIQYKIEREYHVEKKTKAKSHIWDNEIYFLKYFRKLILEGVVPGVGLNVTCLLISSVSLVVGILVFKFKENQFVLDI